MRVCSPTTGVSWREAERVCGGVETFNKRSLCVKYCDQGVQTSFYESTPSTRDPIGKTISPGTRGNSGHAGTNIHNAPDERNNGGASEFPRILFQRVPGTHILKSLNAHIFAPHFCMFTISSVLSTVRKGDCLGCRMRSFMYQYIQAAGGISGLPSKARSITSE